MTASVIASVFDGFGRDAVPGQDWPAVWGHAGLLAAFLPVAAVLAALAFRVYRRTA